MISAGMGRTRSRERNYRLVQWPVVGIDEFNQNLVRPWRKALENDRISAWVCPVPPGVIDGHVNVSDAGRHGDRGRPIYMRNLQILRAILNERDATRQPIGLRRIDDDLRLWLILGRCGHFRSIHLAYSLRCGWRSHLNLGHRQLNDALIEELMIGSLQLDPDLMRPG